MKPAFLTALFTLGLAVLLSALPAMAQVNSPTDQTGNVVVGTDTYTNVVVNSTFTFDNIAMTSSGYQVAGTLDKTAISETDLNNIAPPVQFELTLSSLTYEDTQNTFHGNGQPLAINVAFDMQPNINPQGGQTEAMVTLVSETPISGTVTATSQNPIYFTLASVVVFPLSTGQNIGNLASTQAGGGPTWSVTVGNLETHGQGSSTENGTTYAYNLNGTFTGLGGALEVLYSAPEPNSGWLALIAGVGLAGLMIVRRNGTKSA